MEHILRNVLMALLERPGTTMHDILRMLSDKNFRKEVARSLRNETVRTFLEKEFEALLIRLSSRRHGADPEQSRRLPCRSAAQSDPDRGGPQDLHIRKIMDQGRVLPRKPCQVPHGRGQLVAPWGALGHHDRLAAYSRADAPSREPADFFVYIDEFQAFTTMSLANMLAELRKYRVGFTIAHQYLHQLEPDIRHAVLGNAGTLIAFRVGAEDAPYLVREFRDEFTALDLQQLPKLQRLSQSS